MGIFYGLQQLKATLLWQEPAHQPASVQAISLEPQLTNESILWTGFAVTLGIMFILDLGVFNRKSHEISFREATFWTSAWVTLALAFNTWIYYKLGREKALEFLAGYLIEQSLSVD